MAFTGHVATSWLVLPVLIPRLRTSKMLLKTTGISLDISVARPRNDLSWPTQNLRNGR